MTSRKTARKPTNQFDKAIGGSAHAQQAAADIPDDKDLGDRLDKLEFAIEEISRASKFVDGFTEYCDALKKDQVALTWIRWISLAVAGLMICGLYILLCYVMFARGVSFWLLSDTAKAGMFAAVVAGSITILVVVLRGSFRTISERNKDDLVPEHLKTVLDAVKSATNNHH